MKEPSNSRGFIVLSILLLFVIPIIWFIFDINDIPSRLGVPINSIPGKWSVVLIDYFASVAGAITGFIATAYSVKKPSKIKVNHGKKTMRLQLFR